MQVHHAIHARRLPRVGALPTMLLLLSALLMPQPLAAQEDDGSAGMGTEFFECRAAASAQYDVCMEQADGWSAQLACYIAWDLDNIGCDLDLIANFLILT